MFLIISFFKKKSIFFVKAKDLVKLNIFIDIF